MKRHKKTPKMSRIKVAAFKKRKKLIDIKKHPNGAASLYMQKTVNNCTIPTVDTSQPNFKEVEQFGHKMIVNTEIQKDGNGKMWLKEDLKWYHEQKNARIEYLKKHYSGHYRNQNNPAQGFRERKQPWYMLTRGKCWNYEERQMSFGAMTAPFRVKSELAIATEKTTPKKLVPQAMWEALVQSKLAKWVRKHPRPIKDDKNNPDLFEEQQIPMWEAEKTAAEERFRDFVISVYDKLPLIGRFEHLNKKYSEEKIAELKDINGEGHIINELDPKKSKLLKKAQTITNKVKAKNPKLIATNLKDHKRQKGRIILPETAKVETLQQHQNHKKAA